MEVLNKNDYVTIWLDGQMCGIPVLEVYDVLSKQTITKIPKSPAAVAGVLNLRGQIVTAIDLRKRLKLKDREDDSEEMNVVVEFQSEPYSLIIDRVGDVLSLSDDAFEKNPVTLEAHWQEVSTGIFRLEEELLVILDIEKLLSFGDAKAAA
ncbi:chemotaxis protein CheW [Pseudemcibacter aquimaris]|uniref:chemotaxis protein CheW n=1 Tax=Pseudemcibacter aquimaris TaxID=2857064 RepID=UPI0020117F27|nr:chemotaxis protein CheW [Pseudemcibacter aquimaris]MCC3862209.1 chemotaxis protein CheW [Pseudemcibacter aquimaris]WDU58962.1 chemotaxis protein CheW [Pseudemcibacter aquimaris]